MATTTRNLAPYSTEQLAKAGAARVPGKKALELREHIGTSFYIAGGLLLGFGIGGLVIQLLVTAAAYPSGPITSIALSDMPKVLVIAGITMFIIGLALDAPASAALKKYHRTVLYGVIILSEITQTVGEPLKVKFTVRGYPLSNVLTDQTREVKITPLEDPAQYAVDRLVDDRPASLR